MNRTGKLLSLVAAAVAGFSAQAQTVTTNTIALTTFDAAAASPWNYGYYYGNNGLGSYLAERQHYLAEDVDMTNALYRYQFDMSTLDGTVNYGTGTGAPLFRPDTDPALFVSGDRADYIVTFDARVEGLAEGTTSANAEWQQQFYYRNEAAAEVNLLQVNLNFQPTSAWKTFTFKLDEGGLGANTADSDFEAHYSEVSDVRFNVNFHEPFRTFGYDDGNVLFIDNVKLEVIDRPAVVVVPTTTENIIDWNFDDKPVWYQFSYDWTQNPSYHAVFTGNNNANGATPNTEGTNGGSGWTLMMDNSAFAEVRPDWAGGGTGGGGPGDYTHFTSADLADYQVTFDARAAGMAEGRTDTTTVLQLHIEAPDDSLQPADENTTADMIVRLDFPIKVTSEFKTFTFNLAKGGVGGGAKANFTAAHAAIDTIRTQWQIENAASSADWGFDADNLLVVDNVKVQRIYKLAPELTFAKEGNELVLSWTAPTAGTTTTLQSSTTVDGTYTDVVTEGTTYRTAMTGTQRYFRLASSPEVVPPAQP